VVDLRHKLASVIARTPPEKGKKKRNGGKEVERVKENNGNTSAESGDDELTRRINAEAAEIPTTNGHTDDWGADTSASAQSARLQELEEGMKRSLVVSATGDDDDDDEDEGAENPYELLGKWIDENPNPSDVDVYKKAQELGIEHKHRTLQVLTQALFDSGIVQQIPARVGLLKKMTVSEKHEKSLLGGLERLIAVDHRELIPKVPKILMEFYQSDIVSEDVISKWGTRASKKYCDKESSRKIRGAAKPFLDWLKEADEESEE